MTLQDLGSIGEFVGAILLFVSLVYVGVQVRQNTLSQRALIRQNWTDIVIRWNQYIIQNSELSKLVREGMVSGFEEIDEKGAYDLTQYYQAAIWTVSAFHRHYRNGLLDDETWYEVDALIGESWSRDKALKEYWEANKSAWAPSFRSYMEVRLERHIT
jgi:hypothetical protein